MKKNVLLLAALVSFSFQHVNATADPLYFEEAATGIKTFKMSSSLSGWPVLNPLSTQKEIDEYKKTWDYTKTLKENREALVDNFITTCCDFTVSFEKTENFYIGKSDFMNGLIIRENDTAGIRIPPKLTVRPRFIFSPVKDVCPISANQQRQIKSVIDQITESPVGCSLFRTLVTKYKANNYAKIIFVSAEDQNVSNVYVEHTQFMLCWEQNDPILSTKNEAVIILPKNLNSCRAIENVITYDRLLNRFEKCDAPLSLDAMFFYHFCQLLSQKPEDEFHAIKAINERFRRKVRNPESTWISLSFLGYTFMGYASVILEMLFSSDEEYKSLFGLTPDGVYPINEAAYMSAKYRAIRATYTRNATKNVTIKDVKSGCTALLDKKFISNFTKSFIKKYGDDDLYRFYLDPTYPVKQKLPKFGLDQYQCSDLDPVTGKRKKAVYLPNNIEAEKVPDSGVLTGMH